ncbi:MAG: hypothetical protein ACD_60C00057G0028 [uncultured bacterium]|nr:MAG: hypothetical protein ACD_60C00057G0028 [uncultured bacterium]
MKNIFWTASKARLTFIRKNNLENYTWLFLPGGPGLGSESLKELVDMIDLPGSLWYIDLPGDGSNHLENADFSDWQAALIEAVQPFENVILVAHSSGGMFALATPAIEKNLTGLILMDSAPDAGWQKFFTAHVEKNPLPDVPKLQALYQQNPSNDTLKMLTIACAPYFSIPNNLLKMKNIFKQLPFNYKSHLWAEKNFDATYKAKWIPQKIPVLIFSGDQDPITPLKLFSESKKFKRPNISIQEIKNASHFPWIDHPEQIKRVFKEYVERLKPITYSNSSGL